MEEPILISTTFERQEHAEELANSLLKRRLVACAQIQGPIKSMYWWKDSIAESVEFVLTVKTFGELYSEVEATVLAEHPYDVPEIIAEPIVHVSAGYLAWMQGEIRG
ncbi:divalent-cation tolerance protein CutA [Desulfopila aestuarii]|uniref:Divalent cation tolerance protein n=1 Tax=Desulfopila aestuarii DSM 18488 TaxID=1121416 RepID=A0A1M7Y0X5_9BACT|nr:divalent-cation tolerance protein CutA [Desulfopila aestuarii]SHO45338.1 divalent cation tolerance protein [Desulfopila aestuarii DSM 18488]